MKRVIILLAVIVLIILVWAPWMTDNWCKQRIIDYKLNDYKPVNESWEISVTWIPFGRRIEVLVPESEKPPVGTVGGWGFVCFMLFSGNTFGFTGS